MKERREKRKAKEEKKRLKNRLSNVGESKIKDKWRNRKVKSVDKIMDELKQVNLKVIDSIRPSLFYFIF